MAPFHATYSTTYTIDFPVDVHVASTQDFTSACPALKGRAWTFHHRTAVSALHRRNSYGRHMSVLKVIWGIRWEQSEPAHLSTFELSLLSEGREVERHYLLGQDGQFPPETEGELSYRFSLPMPEAVIRLKVVVEGEGGSLTGQLEDSSAKAASVAASFDSRHRDVRLYFPRERRSLWASAEELRSRIPYFKDLLDSGFSEGRMVTEVSTSGEEEPVEASIDDSDDEDEPSSTPKDDDEPSCSAPFHEVVIADASYHTYKAVLVWLATGHIDFAPLTSSFLSADKSLADARAARQQQVTSSSKPPLPLPVSPKSVYRLADFLSLPALAELALSSFKSQLTISNIFHELFSDATALHPELADVAVDFAARNWEQVKSSGGIEELERRMRGGISEVPDEVSVRLMKELRGR